MTRLEYRAAADPGLRFVELPALGLRWQPARPAIDGGMAAAIRDQAVSRRTLTVYTDLRRVTVPMGIDDRSTIWLYLVDRAGRVAWRGSGGLDPATAAALDTALATAPEPAAAAAQAAWPEAEQFEMAFDARFRLPLAALGVSPATAHVTIAADRLVACSGPAFCWVTGAVIAIWRRERLAPSMDPASGRNARSGASSNEPPTSIPATRCDVARTRLGDPPPHAATARSSLPPRER